MKRFKNKHTKEYQDNYLDSSMKDWGSLAPNVRGNILKRLIERGWFYSKIGRYSPKQEITQYKKLVSCLLTLRKDYLDFSAPVPNLRECTTTNSKTKLLEALSFVFKNLNDFAFYDFLSLYINILPKDKAAQFIEDIDNFFKQLGVNKTFSSDEIIPRQSLEIQEKIIEPTLRLLQSNSYTQINQELSDGFRAYKEGNLGEFILCTINSLASTLEYITYDEITQKQRGFNRMVAKLNSEKLLSTKIQNLLKAVNSYISIERREKTKAHISKIKATDHEALFIFNLVMSIIQYLILSTSVRN